MYCNRLKYSPDTYGVQIISNLMYFNASHSQPPLVPIRRSLIIGVGSCCCCCCSSLKFFIYILYASCIIVTQRIYLPPLALDNFPPRTSMPPDDSRFLRIPPDRNPTVSFLEGMLLFFPKDLECKIFIFPSRKLTVGFRSGGIRWNRESSGGIEVLGGKLSRARGGK